MGQTLADALYGPIGNADTHAELIGSAPGGFVLDTRNGGEQTAHADDHATALAAAGPKALFGPKGPLFWIGALVVAFLVLNGSAK